MMLKTKKTKSVLQVLQDRELNNLCDPYFLSVDIISHILRSDAELFNNYWTKTSKRPISYDSGYLYFNDYTTCFSLLGSNCKPSSLFKFQKSRAQKNISDIISYSVPVYKTLDSCDCLSQTCVCLSQYLLSVTKDNWLCQHSMTTGKLIREFYINRFEQNFCFRYCDWDVYGDRFVLASTLDPPTFRHATTNRKTDIVVNLAVFTVFPFDFFILLEIRRSIFGENCNAANISDQHLIIGLGSVRVNIYSFVDFVKQGNVIPYKLGQSYGETGGKVGFYPTGLPLNFSYTSAPPLLFNVQCSGQIIHFGGYPYHYIAANTKDSHHFVVQSVKDDIYPIGGSSLRSSASNHNMDALVFHPDNSNRLLFKDSSSVHCFALTNVKGIPALNKLFSMSFPETRTHRANFSSFGRKIKNIFNNRSECNIYCTDYASDLDLLAIMGASPSDPNMTGFVKLYDNFTGKEVRTLQLCEEVDECNFYQMYVDMGSIVLIERKDRLVFKVHVYNM